jgi:hypothetical protein
MAAIMEVFVDTRDIIHVLFERDYSARRNIEDLYDIQRNEDVTNNYCLKRNGVTVHYNILHYSIL